ncbi:MAG: COG4315 family predicted lipoprotein [Acidimicrobiia bacterium]
MRRTIPLLTVLALAAGACNGGTAPPTTAGLQPPATGALTTAAPGTTSIAPPTGPSELVFEDQESDGSAVVVASVTLPSPGFVAIHGNADGAPGPVIGHSDLLAVGTTTDLTVTLDEPLSATDMVFPMVHIDINGNGEYEFFPPDVVIDGPGTFADGEVAVVGGTVTVVEEGAGGPSLVVAATRLGEHLVDGEGRTLYLFMPDNQGDPTCNDQCADNWPALTGSLEAGEGVDATLLAAAARADGSEQVTYGGWPLYYFSGDVAPGDLNGQGVEDVWWVVSPAGEPLMGDGAAAAYEY